MSEGLAIAIAVLVFVVITMAKGVRLVAQGEEWERYRMLAAQAQQLEPLLRTEGLLGAAVYKEYRTDDARLSMSVLQTAHAHGAACFNYAQVTNLLKQNDRVYAAEVHDLHTNAKMTIRAHMVINAAGPWVDAVRTLDATPKGKRLHLTKGVHIVVPFAKLPIRHAMYFDVDAEERMVFSIPRDHMVYIGTTDTNYTGSKEHITVEAEDVQYLLSAVAHMFPDIKLHSSDVCSAWAGLRPLIHEEAGYVQHFLPPLSFSSIHEPLESVYARCKLRARTVL